MVRGWEEQQAGWGERQAHSALSDFLLNRPAVTAVLHRMRNSAFIRGAFCYNIRACHFVATTFFRPEKKFVPTMVGMIQQRRIVCKILEL
jgi:hypothetical protein